MKNFIEDSKPKDALWGIVVRSKVFSGTIEDIICPIIPKEISVISASDIPGKNKITVFNDSLPILASEKIHYIGEPILLLAGPDLRKLKNFARQINISLIDEKKQNRKEDESQIIYEKTFTSGRHTGAFHNAFQVIEGEYKTPWQEHHYSDTSCALAVHHKKSMEIICPTQWLFHARKSASECLNIPDSNIIVKQSKMNSAFDGRVWYPSLLAAFAALLCQKTRKSVYFAMSREEETAFSPKRMPITCQYKAAINKDGNIKAINAAAQINTGAYLLMKEELVYRLARGLKGIYNCPNISVKIQCCKSSYPPLGTFRGLGLAQGFFASELHMTRIAELLQTNPANWKKSNLPMVPFKSSPTYVIHLLLNRVTEKSDFTRKHAAYELQNKLRPQIDNSITQPRGIGISSAYQISNFAVNYEIPASIQMQLDIENKLTVTTSISPKSRWIKSEWIHIITTILAVKPEEISFITGTSENKIDSGPDLFGRNTGIIAKLMKRCAGAIAKKRFRNPLPLTVKRTISPKPAEINPVKQLNDNKSEMTWGACVIEAELNLLTLTPEIRNVWLAIACGEISDISAAKAEVESAVLQSLQWCTHDQFIPFLPEDFLKHYHLPQVSSIPKMEITFYEDKQRTALHIENIADSLIPSAFLSAVSQAAGFYFDKIPVTPLVISDSMERT